MQQSHTSRTEGQPRHSTIIAFLLIYLQLRAQPSPTFALRNGTSHTITSITWHNYLSLTNMVYIMMLYTDGGCRNNGYEGAIGAAAAIHRKKWGKINEWVKELPLVPKPTNQRAEITAVIIALEQVLYRYYHVLNRSPRLDVTIHTDSTYVIGCMTKWMHKWTRNGWMTSKQTRVANRDLLETAIHLQNQVLKLGKVRYTKVTRAQVQDVDDLCNYNMDMQERWGSSTSGYLGY